MDQRNKHGMKPKTDWRECYTLGALGNLDRPSITEWIRHLAGCRDTKPAEPVVAA